MSEGLFLVQCMSGHVMEVIPGSELEVMCIQRAESGKLDALCFGYDVCPSCVQDRYQLALREEENFSLFGCPMADLDGKCDDDCPCKNRKEIVDSPYLRQVQYITTTV